MIRYYAPQYGSSALRRIILDVNESTPWLATTLNVFRVKGDGFLITDSPPMAL